MSLLEQLLLQLTLEMASPTLNDQVNSLHVTMYAECLRDTELQIS